MAVQMTTIEVDQNTAAILQALKAKAEARGTTLDVLLKLLAEAEIAAAANGEAPPPNEAMLTTIREVSERLRNMPVRGSTEETLGALREARAGTMWGYEPSDTE